MKDIRQNWKALAADRNTKCEDIAALCLYRALAKEQGKEGAIYRLRKSFNPITNSVKLENGAEPYFALSTALRLLKYSTVFSWFPESEKQAILDLAREIKIQDREIL